jgi:hypothetical protein
MTIMTRPASTESRAVVSAPYLAPAAIVKPNLLSVEDAKALDAARRMQPGTMVTDSECQKSLIRGMLLYVVEGREAPMSANGPSRHWRWFRGMAGTRPKTEVSKPKGLFRRFMSSPPRLIRLIWLIGSHGDEKVFEKKRFRATVWPAICVRIRLGAELVCKVLLQQVTKFNPGSDRKEQEP